MQQGACDVPDYFMYDHVCKVSFWQEADKLNKQKVRFEQTEDIVRYKSRLIRNLSYNVPSTHSAAVSVTHSANLKER